MLRSNRRLISAGDVVVDADVVVVVVVAVGPTGISAAGLGAKATFAAIREND